MLASCYKNRLRIANELQLKSIAFPNISTGIYHLPKKEASEIAIAVVKHFLEHENQSVDKVLFVCYDEENEQLYKEKLK